MKVFFILIAALLVQCISAQENSFWRGPNRDGFYPDKNLLKEWPENGPELAWKYDELGLGYSTAAVTSEKIYITGTQGNASYLFAFNHSGELLWKKKYGPIWKVNYPGVRSTPLIHNGKGYLLSSFGKLFCFNLENGRIIWSVYLFVDYDGRNPIWGITENLLIDGDVLYCTPGGIEANVIALNKNTGKLIWKSKGKGGLSAYCSPLLIERGGNKFFIVNTIRNTIALNSKNGELAWSHYLLSHYSSHACTPIYRDGFLYIINGPGGGSMKLELSEDGYSYKHVWKNDLIDLEHGDAVLIGDNLYSTSRSKRHFYCIDWETGKVKQSVKDFAPGTVIVADGLIYCYSYDGEIALIKPSQEGFEIISSFKIDGKRGDHLAHPVIHDGKLYIRYANTLRVYNIKADQYFAQKEKN